jgi:hypothetical protein
MPVTVAALDIVDNLQTVWSSISEARMGNPGQPIVRLGATAGVVKLLQRGLWRTPDHSIGMMAFPDRSLRRRSSCSDRNRFFRHPANSDECAVKTVQ